MPTTPRILMHIPFSSVGNGLDQCIDAELGREPVGKALSEIRGLGVLRAEGGEGRPYGGYGFADLGEG